MRIISALLKPLSFLPALCLMYMIFTFSAQDGVTSSQLSYKVSYTIVETGAKVLGEELQPWEIDSFATRFHGIVRKLAHMTEYFALAVAVAFPLYVYGMRGILLMIVAGAVCVAFACGDEYHQSFVAGRGPSKRDVGIDSIGIFFGVILVRIIGWTGRKTLFRPFSKDRITKKKQRSSNSEYGGQPYPDPYSGYQNPAYQSSRYPNQPYPNGSYPNQPHQNAGYQNQPYPNAGYPSQPYPNGGYPNQPYPNAGYPNQPYPGGGYPSQPYPNGSYPNQPYPNGSYPNQPRQNDTRSGYFDQRPHGYQPEEDEEDHHVSDKLSEDMSLRKLMRDLKDQKGENRREHTAARKYAKKAPVDGVEIDEIDLDDQEDDELI